MMLVLLLLQAASPAAALRSSLSEWHDCVESSAKASAEQSVDAMFRDAITQCQIEEEKYRSAVVGFATPSDNISPDALDQAANEMVADKKVKFRSEFGPEIAGEIAVRQAIRREVARRNATLNR